MDALPPSCTASQRTLFISTILSGVFQRLRHHLAERKSTGLGRPTNILEGNIKWLTEWSLERVMGGLFPVVL